MSEDFNIIIFSIDLVFVNILKRICEEIDKQLQVAVFQSFSEAGNFRENQSVNLILVDDLIIGTSSYELISFLRLHKKITCPVFYFDTSEYESERKALLIGANQFFNKPLNPKKIRQEIKNTLYKMK